MSAQEGGSDAQAAAEAVEGQKLLRLTDASGQMQLIVEQAGTLSTRANSNQRAQQAHY